MLFGGLPLFSFGCHEGGAGATGRDGKEDLGSDTLREIPGLCLCRP